MDGQGRRRGHGAQAGGVDGGEVGGGEGCRCLCSTADIITSLLTSCRTERTRAMSDGGDDDLFRTFAAVCEEASGRFTNEEKAR